MIMSIRSKILIPCVCIAVACTALSTAFCVREAWDLVVGALYERLDSAHNVSKTTIERNHEGAALVAKLAAENPGVFSSLSAYLKSKDESDRARLIETASAVAAVGNVDFMTITDDAGTVAARTHEPAQFGDKVMNQVNVQRALGGTQYTTIETGSAVKMSVRSGAPVKDAAGKIIGVISVGYRLDRNRLIDELKISTISEVVMFLGDERVASTIQDAKGEHKAGTKADANISRQVLGGKEYVGKDMIDGKQIRVKYSPVRDAEDNVVGMIFNGIDISNILNKAVSVMVFIVIVAIVLCVAAAVFATVLAKRITKPLMELSDVAGHVALGDIDVKLSVTADHGSKDETMKLAASFKDMIEVNKQQTIIIEEIAHGDISHNITPKSKKDKLSNAIKHMIESTRNQVAVMERMADNDLTADIAPRSEKDSMNVAIKKMLLNLNQTLADINTAVGHVKEVSAQIAHGSQSLAEGSSSQASSLEEVSSSFEETSSMTKQNAGNSNQAKTLTSDVAADLGEADAAMKRMGEAINQIKRSSDNTAKIIKTIDEIAFQTNLLALNAAVEAARAGEAGKGFAVVAEEVRNLAMRSAEAAKNTASLIQESVKNADGGVKITEEVAKAINQSMNHSGKVGGLIGEIAAACNERNIPFILDASQSAGAVPIDAEK
ncbi:MAG: methyl-accepting chemotaxis protein, partial [Chitinispirillales bacterium]|nr:methyl-accepting chemotaxis protein [Chitinispirillales bacterium]